LHIVPASFLLTWVLQVMPIFFLIGGYVSFESWNRHRNRFGSQGTIAARTWIARRVKGLLLPVLPLIAAAVLFSVVGTPWLDGVVLLAISPLWFLGVYTPLTVLTPALAAAKQRVGVTLIPIIFICAAVVQYARFVLDLGGVPVTLASFLTCWGCAYITGCFLATLINNTRKAALTSVIGLAGILGCAFLGYPLTMVTTAGDTSTLTNSNMGPPTIAISFLALLQAGLIGLWSQRLHERLMGSGRANIVDWVAEHQMKIYALHLPIWTVLATCLRHTVVGVDDRPTWAWWFTRPIWLVLPGLVLVLALRSTKPKRPLRQPQPQPQPQPQRVGLSLP
jgi:hypothetical protein